MVGPEPGLEGRGPWEARLLTGGAIWHPGLGGPLARALGRLVCGVVSMERHDVVWR